MSKIYTAQGGIAMPEFKVGDKVKVLCGTRDEGKTGEVIELHRNGAMPLVRFQDGREQYYFDFELVSANLNKGDAGKEVNNVR